MRFASTDILEKCNAKQVLAWEMKLIAAAETYCERKASHCQTFILKAGQMMISKHMTLQCRIY